MRDIKVVLIRSNFVGVNLIVGTENGLYLLDRSGYGKGKYSALTYKCYIHCASLDEVLLNAIQFHFVMLQFLIYVQSP